MTTSNEPSLEQKIINHLLAGVSLTQAARDLGVTVEEVESRLRLVLEQEQGAALSREDQLALNRLRENRLLGAVWRQAAAGSDPELIKLLLKLIERQEATPDDPFDAAPNLPGQVESRAAYAALDGLAGKTPCWDDYLRLRAERDERNRPRWNWREALYMAWSSLPRRLRWPRTQEELARQVLGLTNDRTIRDWKIKRPEMQERIARLTGDALMRHRAEVLDALVTVAATPDPKAYSDRRLFLEMTGDYRPKSEISGPDGKPVPILITAIEAVAPAGPDDDTDGSA